VILPEWLGEVAAAVLAAVIAITLHEAAHGYAARALGDDTASRLGRISLNPLRHVDPVGTLLVPGVLLVTQLLAFGTVQAMFGWAKPVPVNVWKLRNPRWGMVLVAAAGPAMNFLLAWLAGLAAHGVEIGADALPDAALAWGFRFIALFMLYNVLLACFNLLPVPPLDGGRILVGLLPAPLALPLARLERVGLLVVIFAIVILPRLSEGTDPVGWLLRAVALPAVRGIFLLSGHEV
jgi:Zn-dependent protease